MNFDITHKGRTTFSVDYATAVELGYPVGVIGEALKQKALEQISTRADEYRKTLLPATSGKSLEYTRKAQIAADVKTASDAELGFLEKEATMRGLTLAGLLGLIKQKAAETNELSLQISAFQLEAAAAVASLSDSNTKLPEQLSTLLSQLSDEAEQLNRSRGKGLAKAKVSVK